MDAWVRVTLGLRQEVDLASSGLQRFVHWQPRGDATAAPSSDSCLSATDLATWVRTTPASNAEASLLATRAGLTRPAAAIPIERPAPTVRSYRRLPRGMASAVDDCLALRPADRPSLADLLDRLGSLIGVDPRRDGPRRLAETRQRTNFPSQVLIGFQSRPDG